MAKWTKSEVNKMTSEQYKELYGNLAAGLTPDQEAFRNFVDGNTPTEAVEPGIRMAQPSPRSRTEIAEVQAFDPSFDEEPAPAVEVVNEPQTVEQPAAVVPPAPVVETPAELPEQIYEYFIPDDSGKQIRCAMGWPGRADNGGAGIGHECQSSSLQTNRKIPHPA